MRAPGVLGALLPLCLSLGSGCGTAPPAETRELLWLAPGDSMGEVTSLAFAPDGKTLAAGGRSGVVRLIQVDGGSVISQFNAGRGEITSVAYSPDGRTIATGCENAAAVIWDPATLESETIEHEGSVIAVAFGAVRGILASVDLYQGLLLWDISNKKRILDQKPEEGTVIHSAAFSPDGPFLATVLRARMRARATRIQVHDLRSSRRFDPIQVHNARAESVALSPDGKTVAATTHLGWIPVWEAVTGKEIRIIPAGDEPAGAVALSPDGRTIARAAGAVTSLFDLVDGREWILLTGHVAPVQTLRFSPSGWHLAAGYADGAVSLWEVPLRGPDLGSGPEGARQKGIDSLWADLAEPDARGARNAIWTLAGQGEAAAAFLADRLAPISQEEDERLRALVASLESEDFATYESAGVELRRVGPPAEGALREAMKEPHSKTFLSRVFGILDALDPPYRIFPNEALRRQRAIQALEQMRSAEAVAVLEAIAAGPSSERERAEAKAALHRIRARGDR